MFAPRCAMIGWLTLKAFNDEPTMAEFAICESVACLRHQDKEQQSEATFSLACGLRNGCLVVLSIGPDSFDGELFSIASWTSA